MNCTRCKQGRACWRVDCPHHHDDKDFLRQLHLWALVDRLFTYVTPAFMAAAIIAAIAVIFWR